MSKGVESRPAIALTDVVKRYGEGPAAVTALAGVSLEVAAGEFVSIMGPSGSGKSTLLNLVAGLDTPSGGHVLVLGEDLGGLSNAESSRLRLRHIGIVFQTFNLFPTFTAEENVAWPLEFAGVGARRAAEQAVAALARVGLGDRERTRRPAELSQGEQQRVAIARALINEPRLLLADEPTGNLDSRTGTAILDLLRALNRERDLSVVMVTHSAFAATYGHRTVEMRDGSISGEARTPHAVRSGRVVSLE